MDIQWQRIEQFLNMIHQEKIPNQRFYLFGHEEGYEKVPSVNLGYLPFYTKEELKTTVSIVSEDNTTIRSNRLRKSTNYIVIHNTGMAHPSATAKGLDEYIHSTTRQASWHYSVDDKEAFQQVPLDEVAWHAGDGRTVFGDVWKNQAGNHIGGGNTCGIGIESCVYAGVDFNMVLRNMAKLTAKLLMKYQLNMDAIKQHYDFSGKNCPQVIREANRWKEFLHLVEIELFALQYLTDVEMEFKSNSVNIMDHFGNVINHPKKATLIEYQVKVTCNNDTKVYQFASWIDEMKGEN